MTKPLITVVARIEGKDRPGILSKATTIISENGLYMKHGRAHVDLDEATFVMQLLGDSDALKNAELKMRAVFQAEGLRVPPFVEATEQTFNENERMYPYLLGLHTTVPATRDGLFLVELAKLLAKKHISIVSYLHEIYEPPLSIGHAQLSLNIMNLRVPLNVVVNRGEFENELRLCASEHGCLDLRLGEPGRV